MFVATIMKLLRHHYPSRPPAAPPPPGLRPWFRKCALLALLAPGVQHLHKDVNGQLRFMLASARLAIRLQIVVARPHNGDLGHTAWDEPSHGRDKLMREIRDLKARTVRRLMLYMRAHSFVPEQSIQHEGSNFRARNIETLVSSAARSSRRERGRNIGE